jgi:hypothetical protein
MQPTDPCSLATVTMLQLVPSNDLVLVCYQSHSGRQTTPIATAPPPDHVRVELGWLLLTRVHPAEMVCHGPSCLLRRGSPLCFQPVSLLRHCRILHLMVLLLSRSFVYCFCKDAVSSSGYTVFLLFFSCAWQLYHVKGLNLPGLLWQLPC